MAAIPTEDRKGNQAPKEEEKREETGMGVHQDDCPSERR